MEEKLLAVDINDTTKSALQLSNWEYLPTNWSALVDPKLIASDRDTLSVTLLGVNLKCNQEGLEEILSIQLDTLLVVVAEDCTAWGELQDSERVLSCSASDLTHRFINNLFVIARQKKTIEQLSHESHCYREMVDSCPDYVFVRDKNNRIVFANTVLARLHEAEPLEMIGKTFAELTGDVEAGKQVAIQDREIISSGIPFYQHEDYYQDDSGSIQWNRVSKKRIPNHDGTDYFVLGVATNLTEWKEKEAQLQESEIRYRDLYMREQVLGKISDTISGTTKTDSMLHRVAELIPGLFNTDLGGILDLNTETNFDALTTQVHVGLRSALESAAADRKNCTVFTGDDNCSIIAAIINSGPDQKHALYSVRSSDTEPFTEQDARLLNAIARQSLTSITKIALHEKIQHQAHHDSLTGLANRFHFEKNAREHLAQKKDKLQPFSILFLDLDGFKLINDSYGHLLGDKVLQVVAQRFSNALGGNGMLARMGGDEFSFLLNDCQNRHEAQKFAHFILEQLDEEVVVVSQRFSVGASIGIAQYPEDGSEIIELMRRADSAMYHAKYNSDAHVAFFNKNIEAKEIRRARLEKDLASALVSDGLELHFQPQFDLQNRFLVGVESLARWQHPELGYISPDEFVVIAEQSHLIHDLGQWVITTAFRKAKHWQECGFQLKTAINLSPRQCELSTFSNDFLCELDRVGLHSSRIEVEVTESILMNDVETVSRHLQRLRARGISVAIDDFGTGYSSLGCLQKLPLDILKIDRSFVDAMSIEAPDKSLIGVISKMAKGLGLTTIVEGVETEEQVDAVTSLGCDMAQGWFFAKAMPANELEPLLLQEAERARNIKIRAA